MRLAVTAWLFQLSPGAPANRQTQTGLPAERDAIAAVALSESCLADAQFWLIAVSVPP